MHAARRFRHLLRLAVSASCLVALSACGGSGGAPEAEAPPPSVAPGTWVVMGSSSAAGAGATANQAWAARLQAGYAGRSVTLVNIAKGGSTTYAGLASSAAPVPGRPLPDAGANVDAALAHTPTLLLISYPTNDTALGYSVDETVRNLLAMRAHAQARGIAVVLLSTQPCALPASQRAMLVQIDQQLSAAVSPCFVAVRAALAAPDGTLDARYDSGDGVHPNDSGHAVIEARVRELLDAGRCVRAGGG